MEIFISIVYVVLILATLLVRRSLKLRSHHKMRQPNVRSSVWLDRECRH
jgi:hypothetical protein